MITDEQRARLRGLAQPPERPSEAAPGHDPLDERLKRIEARLDAELAGFAELGESTDDGAS